MQKGNHLLVDCRRVSRNVCLDDKSFLRAMARGAESAGATVVSQIRYKFGQDSPPGFTAIVMLDESHVSAHTYADLGLIALDVFTCGGTRPEDILKHIRREIDLGDVTVKKHARFVDGDGYIPETIPEEEE